MDEYLIGLINNLILCENIQSFIEINSDKCKIIKNVVANERYCYIQNHFDKKILQLIKDKKDINLNNLLDTIDEKYKSIITRSYLSYIKELNKEFNKKNKTKTIESVDQYMSTYDKNMNVMSCYPSSKEMQNIEMCIGTGYFKEVIESIILYNIYSVIDYNDEIIEALKNLSDSNIVLIKSYLELQYSELKELDDIDNKSDEHIYFFKNGFMINDYFN